MQPPTLSYGRQDIDEADIAAVISVLRSERLTQGPEVPRFEAKIASFVKSLDAVAFNSATSALHAACIALGLGPGDRLWTSPNTFVASANVGHWCGAKVEFIDIDEESGNLSMDALSQALAEAEAEDRLPKIVMPVHFAGQPVDLQSLMELKERYRFRVIEDASHALGATERGQPIGSCVGSDITVFSFHPVKMITTAEGGIATSQHAELIHRMRCIASHGIDRSMPVDPAEPWRYSQTGLGLNYRMTDLQAALGSSQLERLPAFVEKRTRLAANYDRLLAGAPVRPLRREPDRLSSWHLYVIRFETPEARLKAWRDLIADGIQPQVHYIPVPTQPYWRKMGATPKAVPAAIRYAERCLSLPLHCRMDEHDQARVARALIASLKAIEAVAPAAR